jgi:hypothetical protein
MMGEKLFKTSSTKNIFHSNKPLQPLSRGAMLMREAYGAGTSHTSAVSSGGGNINGLDAKMMMKI